MKDELEQKIEQAPDIMTVQEVASIVRMTHSAIGNAIRTFKLRAYLVGGNYRITKSDLKKFLNISDD